MRLFFAVVAFRGSWILNTPMRCHRVTRPDWADFRGRLVADGNYEIHLWGTSPLEFRHVLAAQAAGVVVVAGKLRDRVGVNFTLGMTAGAVAFEFAT
jgi:hypothetical protein